MCVNSNFSDTWGMDGIEKAYLQFKTMWGCDDPLISDEGPSAVVRSIQPYADLPRPFSILRVFPPYDPV